MLVSSAKLVICHFPPTCLISLIRHHLPTRESKVWHMFPQNMAQSNFSSLVLVAKDGCSITGIQTYHLSTTGPLRSPISILKSPTLSTLSVFNARHKSALGHLRMVSQRERCGHCLALSSFFLCVNCNLSTLPWLSNRQTDIFSLCEIVSLVKLSLCLICPLSSSDMYTKQH